MNWRDQKRAMRETVHAAFGVPANMYRGSAPPVVVYVRLHNLKDTFHGDLMGTTANYAVMQDQNPTVVCKTADYDPENLDVLCFATGEAYRVDNVQTPDFITTTAEVLRLEAADAAAYDPPVV